jgi:hypothetical protein
VHQKRRFSIREEGDALTVDFTVMGIPRRAQWRTWFKVRAVRFRPQPQTG